MDTIEDLGKSFFRLLDSIGRYTIERKKNSIHITRKRAFVGLHPTKRYLGINVVLDRAQADPPAGKVEKISANRFHHYYIITNRGELNGSFARLLREAYDLAQPKK
ncbi:MAG TPA: DUF5655 domain-containing protein [Bacteroidota bacterium]|nr:DUF5655 domain-containing protein [Bacteroidota bacterium]